MKVKFIMKAVCCIIFSISIINHNYIDRDYYTYLCNILHAYVQRKILALHKPLEYNLSAQIGHFNCQLFPIRILCFLHPFFASLHVPTKFTQLITYSTAW